MVNSVIVMGAITAIAGITVGVMVGVVMGARMGVLWGMVAFLGAFSLAYVAAWVMRAVLLDAGAAPVAETVVIAHRGASGYLPEHTLAAVAMAHAQGADYIEQDVVLTRDGEPIVLHDITLDSTTDVAARFPGRARADGRHYAADFTLEEIRQLRAGERRRDVRQQHTREQSDDEVRQPHMEARDGGDARQQHTDARGDGDARQAYTEARGDAVFKDRFPADVALFRVPTLGEEIQLIQGLNRSTGREAGLYVELKAPAFHREARLDLVGTVLELLAEHGYRHRDDPIYLQCFDADTLRGLRNRTELRLVQLLEDDNLTQQRAQDIATYADGVGPWLGHLAKAPEFVAWAKRAGLVVHPYTFRADQVPEGVVTEGVAAAKNSVSLNPPYAVAGGVVPEGVVPEGVVPEGVVPEGVAADGVAAGGVGSFDALLDLFIRDMQVDGLFTDHPDLVLEYLGR